VDTVANLPEQQNRFGIDRLRYSESGSLDETPNVSGKFSECLRARKRDRQSYRQSCVSEESRVVVSAMQHLLPEHRFTPAGTLLGPWLIRNGLISLGTSTESCQ
jgi:hypothetical protein